MTFTLTFETDNAAFEAGLACMADAIAGALRAADCGDTEGSLRDPNGNRVGHWSRTGPILTGAALKYYERHVAEGELWPNAAEARVIASHTPEGVTTSTQGDPHEGCPKGGTWRQDPECTYADVCDGCGEGRA